MAIPAIFPAILLLENEPPIPGRAHGAEGVAHGIMTVSAISAGHADLFSDPAYAGKIICFAYPHVCNSGVVPGDLQSDGAAAGAVAREFTKTAANRLGTETIGEFFLRHNVPAIEDIDTRRIAEIVARRGVVRAVIGTGRYADAGLLAKEFERPATDWADWAAPKTGAATAYDFAGGSAGAGAPPPKFRIVVVDLGVKRGFLRRLAGQGCAVRVLPAESTAVEILAAKPDGVVFSSGAGSPAVRGGAVSSARELAGRVPLWGVGLGAGVVAAALGAAVTADGLGHAGVHPVGRTGKSSGEMTSQCHDFQIEEGSLAGAGLTATHFNLNDHSVEGFACRERRIMAVLFHPEAEPGPRDSLYLFDEFRKLLDA